MLADTSAWVEFLRSRTSPASERMRAALARPGDLLVTDAVLMEVLAGARSEREWRDLRRLLARGEFVAAKTPTDWIQAAALHRRVRLTGRTISSRLDCLIAAVAIRVGAPVLAADADFAIIAEHAPLELA